MTEAFDDWDDQTFEYDLRQEWESVGHYVLEERSGCTCVDHIAGELGIVIHNNGFISPQLILDTVSQDESFNLEEPIEIPQIGDFIVLSNKSGTPMHFVKVSANLSSGVQVHHIHGGLLLTGTISQIYDYYNQYVGIKLHPLYIIRKRL